MSEKKLGLAAAARRLRVLLHAEKERQDHEPEITDEIMALAIQVQIGVESVSERTS